jgi:hypothetical protein
MKQLLVTALCFLSITTHSQEPPAAFDGHKWEAPYSLPIPTGWGVERFLLPPSFATGITYVGVEDIRFTPGWAKATDEDYWSYAFLWYLDAMPPLTKVSLEKDLTNYYTGLLAINSDSIKHAGEQPFPVKVEVTALTVAPAAMPAFTATITMRDFLSRKPITLHARIDARLCPDTKKAFVFFELSPQPFTHRVWNSLDQLWKEFKCKRD